MLLLFCSAVERKDGILLHWEKNWEHGCEGILAKVWNIVNIVWKFYLDNNGR